MDRENPRYKDSLVGEIKKNQRRINNSSADFIAGLYTKNKLGKIFGVGGRELKEQVFAYLEDSPSPVVVAFLQTHPQIYRALDDSSHLSLVSIDDELKKKRNKLVDLALSPHGLELEQIDPSNDALMRAAICQLRAASLLTSDDTAQNKMGSDFCLAIEQLYHRAEEPLPAKFKNLVPAKDREFYDFLTEPGRLLKAEENIASRWARRADFKELRDFEQEVEDPRFLLAAAVASPLRPPLK